MRLNMLLRFVTRPIDVNGTDVSDSRTSVNLKSGLRTGENTITVTPQRAFAVDSLTKIIAVYKDGSLVTCNSVNEASNGGVPERFSLTFISPKMKTPMITVIRFCSGQRLFSRFEA